MNGEREVTIKELKELVETMSDDQVIVVNLEDILNGEEN